MLVSRAKRSPGLIDPRIVLLGREYYRMQINRSYLWPSIHFRCYHTAGTMKAAILHPAVLLSLIPSKCSVDVFEHCSRTVGSCELSFASGAPLLPSALGLLECLCCQVPVIPWHLCCQVPGSLLQRTRLPLTFQHPLLARASVAGAIFLAATQSWMA